MVNNNMDSSNAEILVGVNLVPGENMSVREIGNETEVQNSRREMDVNDSYNDGWEVVEASSDESVHSGEGNIDIRIPLKLIGNTEKNLPIRIDMSKGQDTGTDANVITMEDNIPATRDDHHKKNGKQNTECQPSKSKIQKRKKRLFTGDSSDEDVFSKDYRRNKTVKVLVETNGQSSKTVDEVPHFSKISDEDVICKDRGTNETVNVDKEDQSSTQTLDEVPGSPNANGSNYRLSSRRKTFNQHTSSRHEFNSCNTGTHHPLPISRRAKRRKLLDQMWQERERRLKLKMVRKMRNVFHQVLESIVSSSDSEDYSLSDDDMHSVKAVRNIEQPCKKQCCARSHHGESSETENIRRELEYWKQIAQHKKAVSPRQRQMRELQDERDYWKRLATDDAPISSHSFIPRTSTPEKAQDPPLSRPHETSRVTSSVDVSHVSPPPMGTQSSNSFRPQQQKSSTLATRALSVISRTKFTTREKDEIVGYLVEHYDQLELLKGNMFWMQMAHDLDTHRSWHSLKNNFFHDIIKNLEQYDMPNKVKIKIIGLAKHYM